ncbi:CDGP domain-containing protein [Mycolicibacterium mageritense]|uniref:CDGP domain-containing protein n=1 Tax=Mycolicibacterium mageritense TaxID=53462 RepID=UPI001E592788|nr:hypothetical protein [Mycolicibacterium mageritense]MCC9182597.1 hypothetical protein [Mycolicibacterium mageritense]
MKRPSAFVVRRALVAAAAGAVLAGTGIVYAAQADAEPGIGCQTVLWGFLGSQRRTICDGPIRPDGSWTRERTVWWPERWVPVQCSRYSCWGGYWQDAGGNRETYPVTPATVLPDEPGHLVGI